MFAITQKKVEKWSQKKKTDKLIKALFKSNYEIRLAAIKGLGNIHDEKAVNVLIEMLRDLNPFIRMYSIESLGRIGDGRAVEHVRYLAENDTDQNVRNKADEIIRRGVFKD